MQKNLRWSAIPTAMLLLLAACSSTGGSPSASATSAASGGGGASGDPTAVCAADKFGCVKYGPNDKINLGTALSISGANASLGLDSQYGVQVAVNLRGKVAGHDVKLTNTDAGCSADGGTTAAQQLKADPTIVAVVGTSCSSAGPDRSGQPPAVLRAHRAQRQGPGRGHGHVRLHRAEGHVGGHHQ
jgi:hypothetical protein